MPTLNQVLAPLQRRWLQRSPQERKWLVILLCVLLVCLYAWLVHTSTKTSTALRNNLPVLRAQAEVLAQQAAEIEQIRASQPLAQSGMALLTVVEQTTANAGLSAAVTSTVPQSADRIQLDFGSVEFASWLDWVSALRVQGVHVEQVTLEKLSVPGTVSVAVTLRRPEAQ